jgi:hypothetical protein
MATVCENAVVTIAAAWGEDGGTGLFYDHVKPLNIDIHLHGSEDSKEALECVSLALRPHQDDNLYLDQEPLATRKWVLQEQLLSPRKLIFARDQMRWSFPSLDLSEDGFTHAEYSNMDVNYGSIHY